MARQSCLKAIAALFVALSAHGQQCQYCALTQFWTLPESAPSARFRMRVVEDSVTAFFAAQFNHGYVGLQTLWRPTQKRIIFSLWDATAARAMDSRAYCLRFGGEGAGWSCRSDAFAWRQGVEYQFHVSRTAAGWWRAELRGGGESVVIGELKGRETALEYAANFVEQWGTYTCDSAPTSSAVFYPPNLDSTDGEAEVRRGSLGIGLRGVCQRGMGHPYDGGAFMRFGETGDLTVADRALLDALLPKPNHRPLLSREWAKAWLAPARPGWQLR